jgi:hypothetical protein
MMGQLFNTAAARVIFAILILAIPVNSSTTVTATGRIGIYADENRSVNEVWSSGGMQEFTMYVFCRPSENGMKCTQFRISYPDNVMQGGITVNPAVDYTEGDLVSGLDVCFGACQTYWVWTHTQTLVLTDTDPSQILLFPRYSFLHFTTCEQGEPMEAVLADGPLCLNTSCAPDTDPPTIVAAYAIDADRVRVSFSEQLEVLSATNAGNYEIFETDDPSAVAAVADASLEPGSESVALSLVDTLLTWMEYTVRINNVEDTAGNEIVPNSEAAFVRSSTTNQGQIGLYLDENRLTNCADGIPFYPLDMWIWCKPGDLGQMCAEFAVDYPYNVIQEQVTENEDLVSVTLGELATGMSVCYQQCRLDWNWPFRQTLFVTDSLPTMVRIVAHPDVGRYQFANCSPGYPIEDVERCSSVIVNCSGHTLTLVDVLAHDREHVGVGFSKPVSQSTAENEANYEIFVSADTTVTVPVAYAHLHSGGMDVTLTLGGSLVYGVVYTLRVSGVEDMEGAAIEPGSEIEFSYDDTHPPYLANVIVESDTMLTVEFSEAMDSSTATDVSNYDLFELGDHAAHVAISGAALSPDSVSVMLSLAEPLSSAVSYVLSVSNVEDRAGNAIAPESQLVIYETVPPSLAGVAVVDPVHLDVTFDEPVRSASAQATGNYELFVTGDPSETVTVTNAALSGDLLTVRLSLGDSLASFVSYTLSVSNVEDLVGNAIAPGSEIGFDMPDLVPPVLVGVSVNSPLEIEVVFDEPVDSATASNVSNYEITELLDPAISVVIGAAELAEDSVTVVLSLADSLSMKRSYRVIVSNVEDLAGNAIAPGSGIIIYETVPPEIADLIVISFTSLQVRFSEEVEEASAEDVDNYRVYRTGDSTTVVPVQQAVLALGGEQVLLKLSGSLEIEVSYTLGVSDVEDLAGNTIPAGSSIGFVIHDTSPPDLIEVSAEDEATVLVYFNEQVDSASAEQVSNYDLFQSGNPLNHLDIAAATLKGSGRNRVELTLADPLTSGYHHTLCVSDVEDLAGNPMPQRCRDFVYMAQWSGGLIGLYVDESRTQNRVDPPPFTPFDVYVWCKPSEQGMICAEFAIDFSQHVMPMDLTTNPIVVVQMGDPISGLSSCFGACESDWVWTHILRFMLTDALVGTIEIAPHQDVGVYQFANCLPGHPLENVNICSIIYIRHYGPATVLESFSAAYEHQRIELEWCLTEADDEISFFVSRVRGAEDDFREIHSAEVRGEGLTFTFRDDDIEYGESYRYRVEYGHGGDRRLLFVTETVRVPAMRLTLHQNRPNPFNPTTTIHYYLPESGRVVVEIYGVTGDKITTLVDEYQSKGEHAAEWSGLDGNGAAVGSGVYFCRLHFGKNVLSRKMILLR